MGKKKTDQSVSAIKTDDFTEEWVVTYWKKVNGVDEKNVMALFTRNKHAGFGVRNYFRETYPNMFVDSIKYRFAKK